MISLLFWAKIILLYIIFLILIIFFFIGAHSGEVREPLSHTEGAPVAYGRHATTNRICFSDFWRLL